MFWQAAGAYRRGFVANALRRALPPPGPFMKLLVVEDEDKTGDYLRQGLSEAGFVVDLARNGLDGHHLAMTEDFDLIVLDVMLPDVDGWRILQSLRQAGRRTPVLFLTARDSVEDRVKGLESGADDYLVKPFAFSELLARVRTLLRRGSAPLVADRLDVADLVLDLPRRRASRAGRKLNLTQKEFCAAGTAGASARRGAAAFADRVAGLGHELRQRFQCHRRRHPAPARQGRRSLRTQADPDRARHGLHAGPAR